MTGCAVPSGVFHHISPHLADLYFNGIGFRWSQRVVTGQAPRRTRKGRQVTKTLWARIPPALQLPAVFRFADWTRNAADESRRSTFSRK